MARSRKSDIRYRFGLAVRTRREDLKLTQEELADLADLAGIHRTYLGDIERGSRNPSLIDIDRIASALALSLSELFALVIRNGVPSALRFAENQ